MSVSNVESFAWYYLEVGSIAYTCYELIIESHYYVLTLINYKQTIIFLRKKKNNIYIWLKIYSLIGRVDVNKHE